MSVTLQYESWDPQPRFLHRDTADEAIDAAVEMARSNDGRKPLRILNPNGAVLMSQANLNAYINEVLGDPKEPEIDWTQPLYSNGRRMVIMTDSPGFFATAFEDDPERNRWYYNDDGTPFGKNPHPISNFEVDIPQSEFDAARQRELDRQMAEKEAMEASDLWGAW